MWTILVVISAVILGPTAQGSSFNIEINDSPSDMTTFCVGDNITLFCSGGGGSFTWTIPSLSNSLGVTLGSPVETDSMMRFTAERLGDSRSSLMFTAFPELMDINITCSDGGNGMILASAIVDTFGLPSAPDVIVAHPPMNPTNLNLSITKTGESAVCVKEYRVTVDPPGNTTPVPANSITTEKEISANLKICGISPNVSVVAVDRSGRESEPTVPTVDIATSGYDPYSGMVEGELVLLNPTSFFDNCILGNNYIFENIMNSTDSATKISLEHLEDMRRTCTDCILIVTPIFDTSSDPITIFNISINISIPESTTQPPTPISTADPATTTADNQGSSVSLIAGSVGGIGGAVLITIVVVILVLLCRPWAKNKDHQNKGDTTRLEAGGPGVYDNAKQGTNEATSPDYLPTYQDPNAIKREAAGPSGDVYTVVEKKKKGSKKEKQTEEVVAMYSVVDKKDAKHKEQEGLVYADIDVKNPSRSSRSRPPPPPGVTQLDANEPVVYSTVEAAKH